ncbi:33843_t:CDS:1, partial [Gigaspora margarita]
MSFWITRESKEGWATTIRLKHLKSMIVPGKKNIEKKESEIEHVVLSENWDTYLIQSIIENRTKQQELMQ